MRFARRRVGTIIKSSQAFLDERVHLKCGSTQGLTSLAELGGSIADGKEIASLFGEKQEDKFIVARQSTAAFISRFVLFRSAALKIWVAAYFFLRPSGAGGTTLHDLLMLVAILVDRRRNIY